MTALLEVRDLHKRFGARTVLAGVDFTLQPGRVTALVGPNAAGKSTLIKCILGLVRPDQGEIRFDGTPVGRDPRWRARVGYMPQGAPFPENLTGRELLQLLDRLRTDVASPDEDLVHRLGLGPELDTPVRHLSGGTRQKLSAAVAFRARPALAILDEPTAGLDPLASAVFKERVQELVEQGLSVLLTSHLLADVEELAHDVVFLVDGRPHFHGTLEELRRLTGEQRLERAVARLMRARAA